MEQLIKKAVEFGALNAKIKDINSVVILYDAKEKCKEGCPFYDKKQGCPPSSPKYKEIENILKEYKKCMLIQCENMDKVDNVLRKVKNYLKEEDRECFIFGAKVCNVCEEFYNEKCTYPDCKHKGEVIPQMSGCGIDALKTALNMGYSENDFVIQKNDYKNEDIKFYGMVVF